MKSLLKILSLGAVVFMAVAIVEEWDYFASVWFAPPQGGEAVQQNTEAKESAERTVRDFLALSTHLYRSGGDPRFVERMPASPEVVDEMMADIFFLDHRQMYQDGRLVRADIVDIQHPGTDKVEVRTKEFWVIRTMRKAGRGQVGPPRSSVFLGTYRVQKVGGAWIVVAWNVDSPPPSAEPGG